MQNWVNARGRSFDHYYNLTPDAPDAHLSDDYCVGELDGFIIGKLKSHSYFFDFDQGFFDHNLSDQ